MKPSFQKSFTPNARLLGALVTARMFGTEDGPQHKIGLVDLIRSMVRYG